MISDLSAEHVAIGRRAVEHTFDTEWAGPPVAFRAPGRQPFIRSVDPAIVDAASRQLVPST